MLVTAVVFLLLTGLLIAEWRLETRALRCVLGALCAAGYLFLAPSSDAVARRAINVPTSERESLAPTGGHLSDYGSGVATMHREFDAVARLHRPIRSALFIGLVWLVLSPALRTNHARTGVRTGSGGNQGAASAKNDTA